MGLFGGTNTTTTTKTKLNKQQKQLTGLAMPYAKRFAKQSGEKLKLVGDTVVDANANQATGQGMAINAATGAQQQLADSGLAANQHLLSKDILSADSNPALRSYIDAATRPISDTLMEQTLPGLRSGTAVSGGYGSSRQGIAEGIASGKASRAIGDTGATIASAGYGQGLDAMSKALGLMPQTQAAQLAPAQTVAGVGDAQQAMGQKELDAANYAKIYNAMVPLTKAQNLMGLASGTPGGSTSSSSTGSTGLLQAALGGASIGSAIPGAGALGTIAGGGLGALLSLFQ